MNIDEVITAIGQENLESFLLFMNGQTVGIKNGVLDYYPQDVRDFVDGRQVRD